MPFCNPCLREGEQQTEKLEEICELLLLGFIFQKPVKQNGDNLSYGQMFGRNHEQSNFYLSLKK